ncbi:uncharacterized protein podxl2 [Pholidichthys leucotaenia]
MPGLIHITLAALLACCDAFRLGPSQRVIPLSPPETHWLHDDGPTQSRFIQGLARPKRHLVSELVRVQPHLVHDMGWPEIHETSRSEGRMESANSSQINTPPSSSQDGARTRPAVGESLDVQDETERMVHLVVPQHGDSYRGHLDSSDPETEFLSGPGAGDASQEASGFYGTDTEDRDRGEDGGEDRERRGGEEEWEKDGERMEDNVRKQMEDPDDHLSDGDVVEVNHTTPDLDALIGYSPSVHPSSSRQPGVSFSAEGHNSGLQEHRGSPILEVGPLDKELWDGESGYGAFHSSTAASPTSVSDAGGDGEGTATPETDTGTDFGLLQSYTKGETEDEEAEREEEDDEEGLADISLFTHNPTAPEVGLAPSREPLQPSVEKEEQLQPHERFRFKDRSEEEEDEEEKWRKMTREETRMRPIIPLTTDPSPTVGFTDPSWDWLEKTTQRSEMKGGGVTEVFFPDSNFSGMEETKQVVCVDWSELTGRGYAILNMSRNINCEEFRVDFGRRLLKTIEHVFARRMNSPEGSWVIYLSKPTHQQQQLLMNVASVHGVIATKEVLSMLGEIRKSLIELGILNYSAANTCQSQRSQTRSDYGKLFVVLVIIGSICMVIITSGFIYICWQRRLPAAKTTFRAEELHFVVNGCHDNPTLDVTNDSQPEMQEKKPSSNGMAGGGGEGGGEDSSRWQVFVNQAVTEEDEEEQDTHL